jgi:CheY-like chemotaxis protein
MTMPERSLTIVIADDEAPIRLVVGEKLRSCGYTVIEAGDGEQALAAALTNGPAAVISDLQMPCMNGLELATRLKADDRTKDVPVLLLTARGHILSKEQLAVTNVKRVMSKPFGVRELVGYVQEHLAPKTPRAGQVGGGSASKAA